MESTLSAVLQRIADLIREDSNEDDVERLFQPVYEVLGYTERGHDIRGKRRGESGAPDVALLNSDRSFQAIFELKGPAEALPQHRKQLFGYVTELKAQWGALTNGIHLELYRRDGMAVVPVDDFKITELIDDPSNLVVLSKRYFDLEDFSTVETRLSSAKDDPLRLRKLDSFASRVFLETFALTTQSPFGRLVAATMRLFAGIEGRSSFQTGSFGFWRKFFARTLSIDDAPDGWIPFLIPQTTETLSRFMFVLETAYALVARLILAKAIQDKDPRGVLTQEPLSTVLLNHLRTRKDQRTGRVAFSNYPEATAEVFSAYSKSLFIGIFSEDIFDWWTDFSLADSETQLDFGQNLSELIFALVGFDFRLLEGDLLGEMYQSYFDPDTRKALGEFYTPPELVDLILDQVGYTGERHFRLLDPACGSGTFLVQALRRYLRRNRSANPVNVLRGLTEGFALVGFDINPFAVMMAEVNLAAHLIPLYAAAAERDSNILLRRLPVVRTDSLRQEPREGEQRSTGMQIGLDFGEQTIRVRVDLPVGPGDHPLQVTLTFPRLETAVNQGTVRNEREWLITLQALFEAVDVCRRYHDPASGPADLRQYLFSAVARTFAAPEPIVERLLVYADEVWKLVGYLKREHGDGRFIKTLEDLVLGLVLKHDLCCRCSLRRASIWTADVYGAAASNSSIKGMYGSSIDDRRGIGFRRT